MSLTDIFASKIEGEGETAYINLPDGAIVPLARFKELFDSVTSATYNDYISVDANVLGYKDFFDQCKADGILV